MMAIAPDEIEVFDVSAGLVAAFTTYLVGAVSGVEVRIDVTAPIWIADLEGNNFALVANDLKIRASALCNDIDDDFRNATAEEWRLHQQHIADQGRKA